ncbi:MAG: C40 family peptidase [Lachnospiraceae bacterium]|nr:C40 family peptidase [Lachnospiraceae bacterium]
MRKEGAVRKLIGGLCLAFLIGLLCPFAAIPSRASTIAELQEQIKKHQEEMKKANQKADELADQQALIEEMIDDLNAEIINTMTSIALKEDEIAEKEVEIAEKEAEIENKQADIDEMEKEYYAAKAREEQQKEDMEVRARRIYENGNTSFLNLLLRGAGLGNWLNRLDYAEQLYTYDNDTLKNYEAAKKLTLELWNKLEAEKKVLQAQKKAFEEEKSQLEVAKQELSEQKEELDKALAVRKQESAEYESEIRKAKQEANVAKTKIQQEQRELKKLQDEEQRKKAAQNMTFADNDYTAIVDAAKGSETGKKIAKYGLQYVGNPYKLGGYSFTEGIDCSGFTSKIYDLFGYKISRSSSAQQKEGVAVSYENIEPGDIICYSGHVALYIGGDKIVHASNSKPYPQGGIKVSSAKYRPIITIRRILK